jgi:hypothetical protein
MLVVIASFVWCRLNCCMHDGQQLGRNIACLRTLPAQVKGHISGVALRLLDPEPSLAAWARRFFTTLAHRSAGAKSGTNPIYNLLPDVMSALAREPGLSQADILHIMQVCACVVMVVGGGLLLCRCRIQACSGGTELLC